MSRKQIIIFYNPNTIDCYTGVITKTGDVYGFNSNPFHPLGFGQYAGNVTDRMNVTYGAAWRNHFNEKKILRMELAFYIQEARANSNWLGKEIKIEELSEQAQQYIKQITSE